MATWANTTLGQETDFTKRFGSLEMMLQDNDSANRSVRFADKSSLAKDRLRSILLTLFPKTHPNVAEDFVTRLHGARLRRLEQYQYGDRASGVNSLTSSDNHNGWSDTFNHYKVDRYPDIYFNDGVPTSGTSGTFAGTAVHGSFLVNVADTVVVGSLYQNEGTLASPTWTAWKTENLIDRITNPTELLDAWRLWTAHFCFDEMASINNDADERRLQYYVDRRDDYEKQAREETVRAVGLLQIDISNDTFISDYERTRTQTGKVYFA